MSTSQSQLPVAHVVHPIHVASQGTPRVRTDMDYWLRSWATMLGWFVGINTLATVVIAGFMVVNEFRYQEAKQEILDLQRTLRRIMAD
jgi:hypothetical protein